MYDRDNKEYRRGSYIRDSDRDKGVNGGFVSIIILQIFLCVIIVSVSIGIKRFGDSMYTDFKSTYNDIMEESLTIQKINTWIEQAENWFDQAMNIFGKNGIGENISSVTEEMSPTKSTEQMGKGGETQVLSVDEDYEELSMDNVVVLGDYVLPVDTVNISSLYGYREDPFTGETGFHKGMDFAAGEGTDIVAIISGVVSEVGESETYGNYVSVLHESGLETFYAHCDKVLVKKNKKVDMGDVIAKVGTTGSSTGYHVHVETRMNGVKFDPNFLFKLDVTEE